MLVYQRVTPKKSKEAMTKPWCNRDLNGFHTYLRLFSFFFDIGGWDYSTFFHGDTVTEHNLTQLNGNNGKNKVRGEKLSGELL